MQTGTLVVLGTAACVWGDYYNAQPTNEDVMAINDIGMHFENTKHWYSNDARMLRNWNSARRPNFTTIPILHTNDGGSTNQTQGMTVHSDLVGGNSGINAVLCGLKLGYDKIIVCGIPLDNSPYYFNPAQTAHYDNDAEIRQWQRHLPLLKGKVFSMSGRTKDVLEADC